MMKRRFFIKSLSLASVPVFVSGLPTRMLASSIYSIFRGPQSNNRVVVIIQLAGGNDGLNAVIPIEQYDTYYNLRSNIAIPQLGNRKYIELDESLPVGQKLGIHPDMADFKNLYDENKAMIIQNMGYENMNMSHFRGRDIWFMGGDYNDYYHSGWTGRFLEHIYPGYPDDYPNSGMPDPLGLEIGYTISLLFQRETGIPAGLAITDPNTFYELINSTGIEPPPVVPNSHAGAELQYIMDLELKSNQYAQRLKQAYDRGINSPNVEYPETYPHNAPPNFIDNPLSGQLKMVARLLSGNIKTRFFLLRIDGWDTHVNQVSQQDTSQGAHAALLYHVFSAMKAFQEDLAEQGLDHRVLTMTTSEFGRRVYSNDSYGTDHGKAAPAFLFGRNLIGGVIGNAPDLSDLENGNLKYEIDYRRLYTSVLFDWMGASYEAIEAAYFEDFIESRLDIIFVPSGIAENRKNELQLECYPNPAKDQTIIRYNLNESTGVYIRVFDSNGRTIRNFNIPANSSGYHEVRFELSGIKSGIYIIHMNAIYNKSSCKLIVK